MAATRRGQLGQATLEFALLLPVVALIVAVVVQVGLAGVDQIRLWHAAREGARAAAVTGDEARIRRAVLSAGLSPVRIRIEPRAAYRRVGEPVTVSLSYVPGVAVPMLSRLLGTDRLEAEATMRVEQP